LLSDYQLFTITRTCTYCQKRVSYIRILLFYAIFFVKFDKYFIYNLLTIIQSHMKPTYKVSEILLIVVSLIIFNSCKKEKEPTIPVLTTTAVSGIARTSAVSGGNVSDDGGADVTARGVCWSTTQDPSTTDSKTTDGSGTGTFTSNITGLTANTSYYVRSYAINSAGTGYGNQVTFKSSPVSTASLTTTAISSLTSSSAIAGGNISDDGGEDVTARGVCWNTSTNPTIANNKTVDGAGTGSFVSNITNLQPGTNYYLRAYATNNAGTAYGNELTFTSSISVPVLTTAIINNLTPTSATSGGNITSNGGSPVTARGVCWSVSQNPTTANSKTTDGSGSGSFTSTIGSLSAGTTYFVRAYATNSAGTAYGDQLFFTTPEDLSPIIFNPDLTYGSVSDIDGNTYKTIQIGTQTWMAENLKTTKYNDNTSIPLVTDNTAWSNLATPAYCWYENNSASYKAIYGSLYNWFAINTNKLCPAGWHVPTDPEWTTLETFLGGKIVAAGKMKEVGTNNWNSTNSGVNNSSGFTGLPGGYRYRAGTFTSIGFLGAMWAATAYDASYAWYRYMTAAGNDLTVISNYKTSGFSVRCVKN
jgi:uncharacterized protein (TIGR02145 family)